MAKDFDTMEDSNRSANPSIHELSDPARRTVLRGGAAASLITLLGGLGACAAAGGTGGTGGTASAAAAAIANQHAGAAPRGFRAPPAQSRRLDPAP